MRARRTNERNGEPGRDEDRDCLVSRSFERAVLAIGELPRVSFSRKFESLCCHYRRERVGSRSRFACIKADRDRRERERERRKFAARVISDNGNLFPFPERNGSRVCPSRCIFVCFSAEGHAEIPVRFGNLVLSKLSMSGDRENRARVRERVRINRRLFHIGESIPDGCMCVRLQRARARASAHTLQFTCYE